MSYTKSAHKLSDKSRTDLHSDLQVPTEKDGEGEVISCDSENRTYSVTVSKKPSASSEEEATLSADQQKSFISIHSTDQLCQVSETEPPTILEACNVEVLSLNEVFPSTSEESLSDDENSPSIQKKHKNLNKNKRMPKNHGRNPGKSAYVPTNSKSTTNSNSRAQKEQMDQPSGYSDYDIPKNTLYVIGSNPGEPKMSYPDNPKKISKTMKKFLRNIDKHKSEASAKGNDKLSKMAMRGILKDGRCAPECTGDSTLQHEESYNSQDMTMSFSTDYNPQNYTKHNPDKNVTFNTQVVIIHFTGDLCVGQSVETLSKEKDQQARNSELRKTFLTKYNEFWPTQK